MSAHVNHFNFMLDEKSFIVIVDHLYRTPSFYSNISVRKTGIKRLKQAFYDLTNLVASFEKAPHLQQEAGIRNIILFRQLANHLHMLIESNKGELES